MAEMTRKEYREAQAKAAAEAETRDEKRREAEREYAKESRPKLTTGRFDEPTFKKVNSLKKKLNWAIGITAVLLIIVFVVLFFL